MGCVQSGVEGYFVPPVAEDESPDMLTAAVSLEGLPRSARLLLERLRVLSACFLVVAAYFVAVSARTGTYDHAGPAGIALLQAALARRASMRCAERTPVTLAHLRACHLLFLTLTVSKGVSTLVSAERTTRERDRSSLLMDRVGGSFAFVNLLVLALLGYLTYVATLGFSRLEQWCLVVLLENRWAAVEAAAAPTGEAGGLARRRATDTNAKVLS